MDEKTLSVTNHHGNAHPDHNETSLMPVRMAVIQTTANMCWQGCGDGIPGPC